MIKRIGILVLGIALAAAPGAFAKGKQDEAPKAKLKIAALLPGPINDGGWNTAMYNSLKHQEEVFGAEIAYTENTPESDYEEIFRSYAENGFKVIFGHGFQFGKAALKVAPDFTDTVFIINSTNLSQAPNVGSFLVNDFQSGFAQGVIAAITTKTGVVGYIGGIEIPPIVAQGKGFVAGAKYINPKIDARLIMIGTFTDVARAKEVASSLIQDKADVLVGDANEAGLGVVEAAKAAGVYTLGCSSDLYEAVPSMKDCVITSVVESIGGGHEAIIRDVLSGKFTPKNYLIGFENAGAVSLASFRDKRGLYTDEQFAKIQKVIDGLKDGSLDIGK